jgi:hypothetical protein
LVYLCPQQEFVNRSTAVDLAKAASNLRAYLYSCSCSGYDIACSQQHDLRLANHCRIMGTMLLGWASVLKSMSSWVQLSKPTHLASQISLPAPTPYEWTRCMTDLCNPAEGSFDCETLGNTLGTGNSTAIPNQALAMPESHRS